MASKARSGGAKNQGRFIKKPGVQMMAKTAKTLDVSVEDLMK